MAPLCCVCAAIVMINLKSLADVLVWYTDGFLTKRLARHLCYLGAFRVRNPIPYHVLACWLNVI